jgi:pilus assembly protein TadC
MPRLKLWGNRMMCRLINLIIWRGKFTDVSCGFRAYSRETALRLNLFGRFTYTQESFIDLASKGILMSEIPLVVRGTREFGKSKVASNLFWYTLRTVPIMARAVRDLRPLTFFGTIGLIFLLIGSLMFGFLGVWYLIHEHTSPWTSLIPLGSGSMVIGLLIAFIALIADQIGRGRRIDEQLLYYARVRYFREFADDSVSVPGAEARTGSHQDELRTHTFEE